MTNDSHSVWLPRSAGSGAVLLGCHVNDHNGRIYRHSFHWEALTPDDGRKILPGETVTVEVNVPPLPKGNYIIEFDMVSHNVSWFSKDGSPVVRAAVEVN